MKNKEEKVVVVLLIITTISWILVTVVPGLSTYTKAGISSNYISQVVTSETEQNVVNDDSNITNDESESDLNGNNDVFDTDNYEQKLEVIDDCCWYYFSEYGYSGTNDVKFLSDEFGITKWNVYVGGAELELHQFDDEYETISLYGFGEFGDLSKEMWKNGAATANDYNELVGQNNE